MWSFGISCTAGINIVNNNSNLLYGAFPTTDPTNCIAMIANHSRNYATNDTIVADGTIFVINSEIAQNLIVNWLCIS